MVMLAGKQESVDGAQEPGHPEVKNNAAFRESKQQILAPSFNGMENVPGESGGEFRWHRPAQIGIAHDDLGHGLTDDLWQDSLSDDLYLGQLRHAVLQDEMPARLLDAGTHEALDELALEQQEGDQEGGKQQGGCRPK